jgi:hypothetical protein
MHGDVRKREADIRERGIEAGGSVDDMPAASSTSRRGLRGRTRVALVAAAFPVVLLGCGSESSEVQSADTSEADATVPATSEGTGADLDTLAAVEAAGWGDTVEITTDGDTFRYRSNGVPNHEVEDQYVMPDAGSSCTITATAECTHVEPVSQAISEYDIDFTFPTDPELVDDTYTVIAGPMGLLISGAPVYNPFEGDGTTVAMDSNFTIPDAQGNQVPFMDDCMAHPSPQPAAQYHYHGLPHCVTEQVDEHEGPSHIIGMAFDGFPIYGDRDIDGNPIDPADLDECNGITSPTPEFPDGVYHYVLTDLPTEQSTIRCLHGRLDNTPKSRPDALTGVPADAS